MGIRNYSMLVIGTGAPAYKEPDPTYEGYLYTCGWQIYAVLGKEKMLLEAFVEHGADTDFPPLPEGELQARMRQARRGVSRDFPDQRNRAAPADPATSAWGWIALTDAMTSLQDNLRELEPHGSHQRERLPIPTWMEMNGERQSERMRKGYWSEWDDLALKRLKFFRRWLERINGTRGLGAETVIDELRTTLLRRANSEPHDAKLSTIPDLTEKFAIPLQQYLYSQGFKLPVHVVPEIAEQPPQALISVDMES